MTDPVQVDGQAPERGDEGQPVGWRPSLHSAWATVRHYGRWVQDMLYAGEEDVPADPELAFMNARSLVGRGRFVILAFLLGFFIWAIVAPLGSAIIAPGVIVVETHKKVIQHLEGGIVQDLAVTDGQTVKQGQLLLRLEDTQARATLSLLVGESDALAAQEARLIAERDGAETITFPPELLARASDPKAAEAMRGETSAFETRRQTLNKQIDILTQRNQQNARIIAGLRSQADSVDQQKVLIDRESASVQSLYDKGLSTLPRLLALQRQAADLTGQRGQLIEKVAQVQLSSGENELQIANLRNQQLSDVVKDLRDVQTRRFDLLDKIGSARDVLARLTLTAPVSGRVVGLTVHTTGAVIRAGETIMEIVPRKDALEVEARVRPEDANGVYVGMSARVNLSAHQQRRLPVINGVVNDVSADRLTDQRTGQPYFSANVTVDRAQLKDYPDARLIPGMPVEVAIDTGTRTALDYFLEPITDVLRRGMREK